MCVFSFCLILAWCFGYLIAAEIYTQASPSNEYISIEYEDNQLEIIEMPKDLRIKINGEWQPK